MNNYTVHIMSIIIYEYLAQKVFLFIKILEVFKTILEFMEDFKRRLNIQV